VRSQKTAGNNATGQVKDNTEFLEGLEEVAAESRFPATQIVHVARSGMQQ
jgi:hypothetical protein